MYRLFSSAKVLGLFSLVVLFASCKKEKDLVKSPFKATASTWYRVSPIQTPTVVNVDGSNYTTFSHVPGGGEGNATHMGNVRTYFNQLAYTSNINVPVPVPAGSLVAPVIDIINYPIILPFLPFIQPGEFDGLSAVNATLNIPQQSNGKIVSSFFYNNKGDAVFISNSTASVIVSVNPNRNEFSGKALIVGGRGKFANAVGEVDFRGSFNPNNPNEADYGVDGWISY